MSDSGTLAANVVTGSSVIGTVTSGSTVSTNVSSGSIVAGTLTTGAQGPSGIADLHYEQLFTSVVSVSVTHNLGKKPSVTVIDTSNDECFGEVIHNTNNNLTINFSSANSGTVICN